MSRQRYLSTRAKAGLGLFLLAFASSVVACDEDGKTVPERCADPPLPIFDIQTAGTPTDDNEQYPCSTPVGHAVSSVGGPPAAAGTASKGTSRGGEGGEGGGTATAGAGAGGAP